MHFNFKCILCAVFIAAYCVDVSTSSSAVWNQVSSTIDAYSGLTNCYVTVGDSTGVKYQHQKGNTSFTTILPVASASKWICSLTVFKVIEAGYFNLSSRPQDFIGWWTKNTSDPRTQMTVQHLLSFISGFGADNDCVGDSTYTLETCAMKIYNESFQYTPGSTYYYGGNHMTVLGYLATVVTGQDWNTIFTNRVLQPLGIPQTQCKYFPLSNPNPPGGLTTNVQYYYQLLQALYAKSLLPANWTSLMEQDQTTTALMLYSPSKLSWGETWHYCSGHWLECNQSTWSSVCATMNIHSSPGKFGWYPWIDRANDYFAIIGTKDADAATSVELGYQIKSLILQALAEERASPSPSPASGGSPSSTPSRTPSTSPTPSRTPSITPSRTSAASSSPSPSPASGGSPSRTPSRTPSPATNGATSRSPSASSSSTLGLTDSASSCLVVSPVLILLLAILV